MTDKEFLKIKQKIEKRSKEYLQRFKEEPVFKPMKNKKKRAWEFAFFDWIDGKI